MDFFYITALTFFSPIEQYAVASSADGQYYGTQIDINLWKPMTETAQDFSLTQLWTVAGSYANNDLNTIEVGWQVRLLREKLNTLSYEFTGCCTKLCIL